MTDEPIISANLRTLVDGNMDVFRYGMQKFTDSRYEDPTYLGFTIEIDENSALFKQVLPFLEKHSELLGGEKNKNNEMLARIPVYNDFKNKIVSIFKSQESVEDPTKDKPRFIKQHYINSITGFNLLTKKFNKWRDDKLTIELYEDITMYSTYIAYLYNNLIYSYENGRALIPENLLKFNLKIKISEIRNLTSIAKLQSTDPIEKRIVDGLKNNITCIVYTLYDCEFDFFGAQPIENIITQAGIDATTVKESIIGFDIYFKSVARNIFNPLVNNALALDDNVINLGVILLNSNGTANPNGQVIDPSGNAIGVNGEAYQELTIDGKTVRKISFPNDRRKPTSMDTYYLETENHPELKEPMDISEAFGQRVDIMGYNEPLGHDPQVDNFKPGKLVSDNDNTLLDQVVGKNIVNLVQDPMKAIGGLEDRMKSKGISLAKQKLNDAIRALQTKRNSLVRTFIHDLEKKVGLKKIIPSNVNDNPDYYKNQLEQLKSDIGFSIGDEVIRLGTGM